VVSSVIIAAQNPLGPARLIDYVERLSNVVFLMRADPAKAKSPDANPLAAAATLSLSAGCARKIESERGGFGQAELLRRWRSFWRKRQHPFRRTLQTGRGTRFGVQQLYVVNQSLIGADFPNGAFSICEIRRNEQLIF